MTSGDSSPENISAIVTSVPPRPQSQHLNLIPSWGQHPCRPSKGPISAENQPPLPPMQDSYP